MLGSADFDIIILSTDRYSVYQLLRFRHSCLRSVFFYFYFLLERGRLYCIEVHNIPRYHFQDFSSFSASMTKPPFPPFPNHSAGSICQRGGIRTFVAKSKPTRVETYIFFLQNGTETISYNQPLRTARKLPPVSLVSCNYSAVFALPPIFLIQFF